MHNSGVYTHSGDTQSKGQMHVQETRNEAF